MTHPTIKLLEEAHKDLTSFWASNDSVSWEDIIQIVGPHLPVIEAALCALIEKHEDVEGDVYRLPNEVFVTAEGWDSFFECTSAYRDARAKNVPSAPYHRADTIINEITRRIEDGE